MPALMGMKNKKNLDEELKQLALEAQRYPPGSLQRQKALTKLIRGMQNSGRLVRPPALGFARGILKDIQETAYQQLFSYICEHIELYNAQKDVLQWANFLLRKRFFTAMREILEISPYEKKSERVSLDTIKNYPIESELSLTQQIVEYLEEDPEGIFKKAHISNKPAANFKTVALRLVAGYSWKELASEFNVEISTLSSFYYRCLKKFSNRFQQALMR